MKILRTLFGFFTCLSLTLSAQKANDLIYTVVTPVSVNGNPHMYLVWTPGAFDRTAGFDWSLYAKSGGADAETPYALQGRTRLQQAPATVMSLLRLGASFDADGDLMRGRIETLFADVTSQSGAEAAALQLEPDRLQSGETEPTLDTARKVIFLSEVALGDPETANSLMVLGRTHPGVMLALGHAYMAPAQPGLTTYELRSTAGGGAERVLGRVTFDAANPVTIPAPTELTRVMHVNDRVAYAVMSPKDHLNARFLWATPNALREVFASTNGFNLYRVPEALAQSEGWTVGAPDRADLLAAVEAGTAARVNRTSIYAAPLLDEIDLTDEIPEEFAYFADDNRNVDGELFQNGDTFYYFAAARDLVGHPGLISEGLRVVICDRMPPPAPELMRVEREYVSPADGAGLQNFAGDQSLAVVFRQLPEDENPANPQPVRYLVYRWLGPEDYRNASADPEDPAQFIGEVAHAPGEEFGRFIDNGAGAPSLPDDEGEVFWYTVRAEESACGGTGNLSPHSPPSSGALRDRVGPDAPDGVVMVARVNPMALGIEDTEKAAPPEAVFTPGATHFLTSVERLDPGIGGYEMTIFGAAGDGTDPVEVVLANFTHNFIGQDSDLRLWPWGDVQDLRISVVPIGANGRRGVPAEKSYQTLPTPSKDYYTVNFITFTDEIEVVLDPDDPEHDIPLFEADGPRIILIPAAGTAQWRIYRRVGVDAELELVETGTWDGVSDVNWQDVDVVPVDGVVVCYYGQTLDAQGNPSVLHLIGCTTIRQNGSALPVPLLADPVSLGTDVAGAVETVRLEWFCDPVGVSRFEILVQAEPAGDTLTGPVLSQRLTGAENIGADGEEDLFDLYQSPAVEGGFGSGGAEFSMELNLPVDATYRFTVRAVGSGAPHDRPTGDVSNIVAHSYRFPPGAVEPVIPWPQRPLGGVTGMERGVVDYPAGTGPFHAMILPEGPFMSGIFMGTVQGNPGFELVKFGPEDVMQVEYDAMYGPPLNLLFDLPSPDGRGESLGAFMVYRYQLPSVRFPDAVPNLTQISPLIDRLAYEEVSEVFIRLHDPWIYPMPWTTPGLEVPLSGTHSAASASTVGAVPGVDTLRPPYLRDRAAGLFFVDRMPVTVGATYRYLIVRFDTDGEVKGVFPTNPVTIVP